MSSPSEHLTGEILERYRRQELSPVEISSAEEHLDACLECRRRLDGPDGLTAELIATRLEEAGSGVGSEAGSRHLAPDQVASYVDGKLKRPERHAAEEHLKSCARCAEEIERARSIRALRKTGRRSAPGPIASPAAPQVRKLGESGGFRQSLLAVGAAATGAVVALTVVRHPGTVAPGARPEVVARLEAEKGRLERVTSDLERERGEPAPGRLPRRPGGGRGAAGSTEQGPAAE